MGRKKQKDVEMIEDSENSEEVQYKRAQQATEDLDENMEDDTGQKNVPDPKNQTAEFFHSYYTNQKGVMQRQDYEDDQKPIKEKLWYLINKGKSETKLKSAAEKADMPDKKQFMQHVIAGQQEEIEMHSKDFLTDGSALVNSKIERPPCPFIDPNEEDFDFFCLDIDHYVEKPPKHLQTLDQSKDVSIVRLYGVTQGGNSLTVHVFNFKPYFYIQIPNSMEIDESHMSDLMKYFNSKLTSPGIEACEFKLKKSIMHYSEKKTRFVKVTASLTKYITQLRQMIEKGLSWSNDQFWNTTYESSVPHGLRFMIDNEIVGMSWITLKKGQFSMRPVKLKKCTTQMEIDVIDYKTLNCHKECLGKYQKIAPLRIMSFDIECLPDGGKFPTADKDSVIQIGNICQIMGQDEPYVRNVFVLDTCAPIVGTQVFSFKSENDLLVAWREFVRLVDPDIVTGYNIINFDMPYIVARGEALSIPTFPYFGRVKDIPTRVRDAVVQSKAMGNRETKDINIEGRVQFDLLQYFLREHKLRSYTLNSVSSKFLGEQKEQVQANQIADLQLGNEFTRRRLAIYCVKDSFLPLRLISKLEAIYSMTEISRVCGVPLTYLFQRGQQIKVASLLYRQSQKCGLLIPTERDRGAVSHDAKYEGGCILEAVRGYYQEPCAVLDFASLYPSIMMAHNLCYSTIIPAYRVREFNEKDISKTPQGDYFIKQEVQKGVLPLILESLVSQRNKIKEALKVTKDPFELKILENRSLALKLSANSVYGFTGASVGQLPCMAIAASVTAYGRKILELTQSLIQEKYNIKNGNAIDSQVFYGDTDSVMVRLQNH